jgi:hypothetical protein
MRPIAADNSEGERSIVGVGGSRRRHASRYARVIPFAAAILSGNDVPVQLASTGVLDPVCSMVERGHCCGSPRRHRAGLAMPFPLILLDVFRNVFSCLCAAYAMRCIVFCTCSSRARYHFNP